MIKSYPHQPQKEQEANVSIYVYTRVLEHVTNEVIFINEVFQSNYFALSKRISSSSLDVYLHFQSGDQVFKNIKKYFEITQSVHHRWLDVIKAAIELDISLSLEENLLSSSITDGKFGESLSKLSEGVIETVDSEIENKINDWDIIIPIRISSLEGNDKSLIKNLTNRQSFFLLNPEIIVQRFESHANDIRREAKIKNITISDSSHLNVLLSDCHSFCRIEELHSNVLRKTHLFTTSQQLSRVTQSFSKPKPSLNNDTVKESDLQFPDLHFPLIEMSDSTFIKLSSSASNFNGFNEQYSNSSSGPSLTNMNYTTCEGDAGVDTLGISINCLLPINHLSNSQGKLVSQIHIGQVRHISIFSCQVNNELNENLSRKSCSTTESLSSCSYSMKDPFNACTHESFSDIPLHETDVTIYPLKSFTPERIESKNPSNSFVLISNSNFIFPKLGILILSPSRFYLSSLSVGKFYYNENQLVRRFQGVINEPLQLISELPFLDCRVSICPGNVSSEIIQFHYWSIKNTKDIGYMSYFRSFTLPTRRKILQNRQHLPCSKDLRLFSTSFQRFQYSAFFSEDNPIAHQLEHSMNIENQMLQSKYLSFPQLLERQSGEIPLKPAEYPPAGTRDRLQTHHIPRLERKGRFGESKPITLSQCERIPYTVDPLFSSILRNACLYSGQIKIPNQQVDNILSLKKSSKIEEELRCLNLIVYFLEELFDIWTENMVSMTDVQNILHRLFSQLRIILLSISRKKNIDKLTKLCASCVEDIESALNYAFDAICVLIFLKSIVHKLNLFGKFILSYSIIPITLKDSLFRLFLRYKTVLNKQKHLKLQACLIEVYSNPELLESLFNCSSSDRRIRYIEKKSNCSMVLQPPVSPDEHKRLIKVYCTSDERSLNIKSIISMITSTLNKPFSKIQITAAQSLTESEDKFCEIDLHHLGDVRWSNFRYI